MKKILGTLCIACFFVACSGDDGDVLEGVSPRTLGEVLPEDEAAIEEFLATHFYNYEDFDEPIDPDFDLRVRIDTIAGENADKTPLAQQVKDTTINVSAIQLNLDSEEVDIGHKLYYIEVREGAGPSPTIGDSTLLRYNGTLLDNSSFDAVSDFVWQELPFFLRGFHQGVSKLKTGTLEQLDNNPDGTVRFNDSGIGIIIMPSGLAYFLNSPSTLIPAYSPLVFSVEIGQRIEGTDNDNDGVPNIMEDLDGDGDLFNDNTDNDVEEEQGLLAGIPNFRDTDDDGDGILTRTEISDADGNIIFPYPDSNNDGIPDYLDIDVERDPNN